MGSFNANILPATTGLNLGNSNQQWIAYLSNAFTGTVQSLSFLPALSGFMRLASTDAIAWRNNANTADVLLSKTGNAVTTTPADTLVFSGSGIEGPFISHNINPAAAGELRLATGDAIYFRNNANGADVVGLQHNTDDTVTAGGSAGIKEPQILSSVANQASAGFLRMANGDLLNWRDAGNSADEGLSNASNGGLLVNGANPHIHLGGVTASFPMIKRSGTTVVAQLSDDSAMTQFNCEGLAVGNSGLVSYKGRSPQGEGVPILVGVVDLAAQTAAISASNLVGGGVGAGQSGTYRVTWYSKITTAAGVSSTLGPLTITFTDADSVVQTLVGAAVISAGTIATTSTANTTTTLLAGVPLLCNVKGGTAFQYTFGYASNAANAMNYSLIIRTEFMG